MNNRLINTKVAGGGGGCTDIVDNYDPFGGNGVALYQLNGNANDVSGNYNGTATNVTYGTGVFGQAGVFNGISSYVNIDAINLPLNDFTVSAWANTNNASPYGMIVSTLKNGQGQMYFTFYQNQLVYADLYSSGSQTLSSPSGSIQNNIWYHCVITKSSTSGIKLYLDGSLVDSNASTTNLKTNSNGGNRIGQYFSPTPLDYFNGSIDQVRIFNTALDPLEVEALYTEELCICDGTVDTLQVLGDTSCIATYQLDGNANDLSGNYSGQATDVSYGVGEFDLAGVFNGSSSKIDLPNLGISGSATRTISAWINVNSLSGNRTIFQYGNASANNRFGFAIESTTGKLYVEYYGRDVITTTNQITANTWFHVAATYNGGVIQTATNTKIYVNGSEVTTTTTGTATGVTNTADSNYGVGYRRASSSQYFNGSIDQVRIFNKALNSTEVTTLYNETACTKAACSGTTNTLNILGDSSCVAAYPLDGSPADLSGNYNGVQTDVTYPQGYFDLAGAFNGSSSVIRDIPNSISTSLKSNNAFTYSFWIKFNSLGSQSIIQFFNDVTSAVSFNGTNFTAYIYNSSVQQREVTNSASVTTGVWYNVVFKGDSNGIFLYVNNNTPASTSWGGDWFIYTNATYKYNAIGARQNSGGFTEYVDGEIDQVRIFNKALSAGEVTTLYNETPCN